MPIPSLFENALQYTGIVLRWLLLTPDGQQMYDRRTEHANDALQQARAEGKLYYQSRTVRLFSTPNLAVVDPSVLQAQSIQKISSGTNDPHARKPFYNFKNMLDLGDHTPLSWVFKQDEAAYQNRQVLANLMRPNRFEELDNITHAHLQKALPTLQNPGADFCLYQWVHQLTMGIIAEHVLGLTYFPARAHAVLDKAEVAIVRETEAWRILGYDFAFTASQQRYLEAKKDFSSLAQELIENNLTNIGTKQGYLTEVLKLLAQEHKLTPEQALQNPEVKQVLSCAAAGLLFASGTLSTTLTMGLIYLDKSFVNELNVDDPKYQKDFADAYFKEALRFTSSAAHNLRWASETTELKTENNETITIPANSYIVMDHRRSHQNASIWKDPENFRPERFVNENSPALNSRQFTPFSFGPRMCPGRLVAEQIFKSVINFMVKNNISFEVQDAAFKNIMNESCWTNRDFVTRLRAGKFIRVNVLAQPNAKRKGRFAV